ncbi:PREDICTED: uncharacterized protein LOC106149243 [Chinchilla lanigera]|uniref:uncharacterized protein LOC106149243 n=1 Tax=Chinchilla lanigera TaxID=34839 RepID=UPI0006989DAF|nr:PREDICTED: uncharacterized protein LOC106149243 [Chinchilla lanigera]
MATLAGMRGVTGREQLRAFTGNAKRTPAPSGPGPAAQPPGSGPCLFQLSEDRLGQGFRYELPFLLRQLRGASLSPISSSRVWLKSLRPECFPGVAPAYRMHSRPASSSVLKASRIHWVAEEKPHVLSNLVHFQSELLTKTVFLGKSRLLRPASLSLEHCRAGASDRVLTAAQGDVPRVPLYPSPYCCLLRGQSQPAACAPGLCGGMATSLEPVLPPSCSDDPLSGRQVPAILLVLLAAAWVLSQLPYLPLPAHLRAACWTGTPLPPSYIWVLQTLPGCADMWRRRGWRR